MGMTIILGALAPIILNLLHLTIGIYVVMHRGSIMSLGFTSIGFLTKTRKKMCPYFLWVHFSIFFEKKTLPRSRVLVSTNPKKHRIQHFLMRLRRYGAATQNQVLFMSILHKKSEFCEHPKLQKNGPPPKKYRIWYFLVRRQRLWAQTRSI